MEATYLNPRYRAALQVSAILNALTIPSAGLVAITLFGWPDIVAGGIIATINLWAAGAVLLMAGRELSSGCAQ